MRLTDENGNVIPHWLSRRTDASISSATADVVHVLDGDESAIIYLNGKGALNATYIIEGSANASDADAGAGADWNPVLCYPYTPASLGGTLPQAGQPLFTEAVNAATVKRQLCLAVGGLRRIRVRLTAYSSGNLDVSVTSDACASMHPYVCAQKSATLLVSTTAAVGVAVTATLPSVSGMRHYIDYINVKRCATAALTPSATPVLVTTTNLPGPIAMTFGSDAGGVGVSMDERLDFGASGLAASAVGTATSVVCPAYVGVIWRVNVAYRLGL